MLYAYAIRFFFSRGTTPITALIFKGRVLVFRRNHNFANLFSKLSGSTFYKEISKFQAKKCSLKSIRLAVLRGDSLPLLRTPVSAFFSFAPKLTIKLLPRCNAFWGNIYQFAMPKPPGELMTREKDILRNDTRCHPLMGM